MEIDMTIYVTPHENVENEDAWTAAAKAAIAGRAAAKKDREFRAANEDADEILRFVADKAFSWATEYDWERVSHNIQRLEARTFFDKLHLSILKWGAPTQGQADAVRRIIDQEKAKKAEWKARDARSEHIGEVGKKIVVEAVVTFRTSFEGFYGWVDITGFRVGDNVIIHKGKAPEVPSDEINDQWGKPEMVPVKKGDRVMLKATVKDHGEREGVKQTIVTRPKATLLPKVEG
jgi:hypothetical protein